MLVHKVVLLIIHFCTIIIIIKGQSSDLNEIIHGIQTEFDITTVCIVGFENTILSDLLQKPFDIPLEILNTPAPGEDYRSPERRIILVVQVSKDFSNYHHFINKIRFRKFVVIYGENVEEIHQYFSFFWEKHFTRIYGIASNITYAYLPFADNPVQEIFSNANPLPNSLKDLNGFALRTTVQADPPRVFWYTGQDGHRHIGGSSGELFVGFLQRHNATFVEAFIAEAPQHVLVGLNWTFEKQIDISMNTFEPLEGLDSSYPIAFIEWAIMVPIQGYVDSSQYFLKPFQPTVWLCFGTMLIFLILADMLKDWLIDDSVDFWNSFSRIFLIFLNMPLPKPTTNAYRFDIQLHILVFICVNFYLIFMTSFLTVYIKVNQFESIQDLIDNNVPVKIVDYDWKFYSNKAHYPDGFESIIVLENRESFLQELEAMKNTNFAYSGGSDALKFILQTQLHPKFRVIRESLQDYYLTFILAKDSPFLEILNDFIIDVLSTGLVEKWTQNAVVQTVNEGLVKSDSENLRPKQATPLTLYHFKLAWICFAVGILVATGVFMVEMFQIVFFF